MKRRINKLLIAVCILLGFLTTCIDDKNIDVNIVTNAFKPTLSQVRRIEKTASTITLEGEIESANGYAITEKGICWGTTKPLDISKDSYKTQTDGNNIIHLTAEDLQGSTLYYYCLYAKNQAGIAYSNIDSTITNDGLGSVKTFIKHENTRATTAIAGGYIEDRGEGEIKKYGIYYSVVDSMSPKDSIIGNKIEKDIFVCDLSNLAPSTIYYIKAYVINSFGIFMGDTVRLITDSGMPNLSDDITIYPKSNKATVQAEVLSVGDAPIISRGFCWNTTGEPQVSDNKVLVAISGDGTGLMTIDLQPLLANQQYYVSAFAENEYGIKYSSSKPFTTTDDLPTVITLDPPTVNDGSVIFSGRVMDVGESNVTTVGVCYSATRLIPTIYDPKVEIVLTTPLTEENVPYNFSTDDITGLRGATTYHFRAFATNGKGTNYGGVVSLQTPPIFIQESESFEGGARVEGSSAYFVIGDKGYLLGGDIGPTYINNLWSYNPILNQGRWGEFKAYTAGQRIWLSTAVVDTRVYVLGGLGIGSEVKDDFYVYNTVDNLWFPRPIGPDSAYSRAGFSLNNEVVYVGGMKNTAINEVWAYNVSMNSWSKKADFPVNQYGGIAVTIDNNVYAGLGKNTSGVGNKQLWKSNGALLFWTPEPIEVSLSGNILAGVVFNNKIYVIDKPMSDKYAIFEYDPTKQTWEKMSDLPNYSWSIQFMYSIRNRIYIGFADTDKVIVYNPMWDN